MSGQIQGSKRTTFIHLRTRHNGIPSDKGGYSVAIKPRPNGLLSVSICQCNTNQRFDPKLGEKVSETRLNRGQFFVQTRAELIQTLTTLHEKLSTGAVVRLSFDELNSISLPDSEEKQAA
jgi:hypothetical protein